MTNVARSRTPAMHPGNAIETIPRSPHFAIPATSNSIDWNAVDAEVAAIVFDGQGRRLGLAIGDWRRALRIVADSGSSIAPDEPLTLIFRTRRADDAEVLNEYATDLA